MATEAAAPENSTGRDVDTTGAQPKHNGDALTAEERDWLATLRALPAGLRAAALAAARALKGAQA